MMDKLLQMNTVVGKTSLDDVYSYTPSECDYMLAGGYQRSYNQLRDSLFVASNAVFPVAMIDPSKIDTGPAEQSLQKRQQAIKAMTDNKLASQMKAKEEQQQRFIDLLMPVRKGGKKP